MPKKYVVIGAGVAGTTACEAIRKRDRDGEIRVFTDEAHPFYTKIRLPELLAGRVTPQRLILKGESWFQENGIVLQLQEKVTRVERDPLTAITDRGSYQADRLLLATGGYSFVPPIPGSELKGVFTLRTLSDAQRIVQYSEKAKRALLIGGGLLGLEAGNGLRLRGLRIRVAEIFDRLLPRQMDPEGARVLQAKMEEMGFEFWLGVRSKEIKGEDGKAMGLELEDGRFLEADVILISAGVRPHLELAQQLNLEIGRGVVANDRMETSLPGVYAAGDAVEHRGVYYGIWPASEAQGRVAGENMASGDASYKGTVMSNKLKVVEIDLVSAGEIDAEGSLESEVETDLGAGVYRKIVYEDDRIAGCILLGDIRAQRKILQAIERGTRVGELKGGLLKNPDALARL